MTHCYQLLRELFVYQYNSFENTHFLRWIHGEMITNKYILSCHCTNITKTTRDLHSVKSNYIITQ